MMIAIRTTNIGTGTTNNMRGETTTKITRITTTRITAKAVLTSDGGPEITVTTVTFPVSTARSNQKNRPPVLSLQVLDQATAT